MNPTQRIILLLVCGAIVLVNIWGAMPQYKTPYGQVGEEVVSVYEPLEGHRVPSIPIRKIAADHSFVDTGKKVEVYLRNDYRDEVAAWAARCTLVIVLCGALVYRLAGIRKAQA